MVKEMCPQVHGHGMHWSYRILHAKSCWLFRVFEQHCKGTAEVPAKAWYPRGWDAV